MSRASWLPFENDLRRLLIGRGLSAATAKAVAGQVVTECGHYLNRPKFESFGLPRNFVETRDGLIGVASSAGELRTLLKRLPIKSGIGGWKQQDSDDLNARLDKLCAAGTEARMMRPRPGRPRDFRRHTLEENIAAVLMRHDVTVTTSKAGTFALVLEQVHSAVGISERDVHKSVRRAHSALKKARN